MIIVVTRLSCLTMGAFYIGKQTAKMAVEILKDGKKPADMPIQYLDTCDLKVNQETAKILGITIPADL